jgi:hypothetical protein
MIVRPISLVMGMLKFLQAFSILISDADDDFNSSSSSLIEAKDAEIERLKKELEEEKNKKK